MKKVLVISGVILVILLSVLFVIQIHINNKIVGTWKRVNTTEEGEYIVTYKINKDTIINHVVRPDGTEDTYDLGKYDTKCYNITYKNPNYENGFGSEYQKLEYSCSKDKIYVIENNNRILEFTREK